MAERFPPLPRPAPPAALLPVRRAGTVALVGRSNVGKSTLLNALLGEHLSIVGATPQTTREAVLGVLRHGDAQIAFLDTPGLHQARTRLGHRMNAAARTAVAGADVVLFVSAPGPKGRDGNLTAPHGDEVLLRELAPDCRMILVLNKVDLVTPRTGLLPLLTAFSAQRAFDAVVPLSARRRDGLSRLLDEVAAFLPEGGPQFEDDYLTDRPVRFFAAELVRERILQSTREELPYAVAVTIDAFDERPGGVTVTATIHVEREGQKAILIGHGGTHLRDIGTNARHQIGRFLDRPAHLSLFVRVTPGWRNDPRVLTDFGYVGGGEADS